jgi:glycosyltransferase involved in cell wall biosynthesis
VATRISGHQDAIIDGRTGILVDGPGDLIDGLDTVLRHEMRRNRLGQAALEHASRFTWDATARGALAALGAESLARS